MGFGNPAVERKLLERTYDGKCTVTEFQQVKDPITKATKQQPVVVLTDQPCALSQTTLSRAQRTDTDNKVSYDAKLFISPDVIIKAGSLVRVVQQGMDFQGEPSGVPFKYPTHQEIMLTVTART